MTTVAASIPVLRWAAQRAGLDSEELASRFKKWPLWITGEAQPTLKQHDGLRFPVMDRSAYPVRLRQLSDHEDCDRLNALSPAERLDMVWPLTRNAWAFHPGGTNASRLSRHVVRVTRVGG